MFRPDCSPTTPPKDTADASSGSDGNSGSDARVPLSELPAGASATIDLEGSEERLEAEDRQVLRAMGFAHRATVRICRQGEPCIVEVESARVGLARVLAAGLDAIPTPAP